MGDDQFAAIEDVMAHQSIEIVCCLTAEGFPNVLGQCVNFRNRLCQAVLDLHVLGPQFPHELHIVVAGDAKGRTGDDHVADQPQSVENPWATIHNVAKEHHLPALGMLEGAVAPQRIVVLPDRHVAQLLKQGFEFIAAAVQITDDVKRPVFIPLVVPEWGPLDDSRLDLFGRLEDEDVREAFSLQSSNGSTQLRLLLPDDVRTEVPVFPAPISLLADLFGQVEDQCDRKAMVLSAKLDEQLAGFGLNVRGIDDRQTAEGQPLSGDEVQNLECVIRRRLGILIVADHPPARIGGQHLSGQEMFAGEGALARATGADQDDEREIGDRDGHGRYQGFCRSSSG